MNKFTKNTLKSLLIATTLTTGLLSTQMEVHAEEGK